MDLSKHLSESLDCALGLAETDLKKLNDVFFIQGMSALRIKVLLNELMSSNQAKYLEVGIHAGSTFIPAIWQNTASIAYAVDDWSEYVKAHPRESFYLNCRTHLGSTRTGEVDAKLGFSGKMSRDKGHVVGKERAYHTNSLLLEKDFFETSASDFNDNKFNIYFYDGDHTEVSQYKALEHMLNIGCLEDEFIFLVDDYVWEDVRNGTQRAIKDLNLKVIYEKEFIPECVRKQEKFDEIGWWNGFYISLLGK